MHDYRKTLGTVGTALIVLGTIDVGVMIYCIAAGKSYHSSFNLFAVVAGVYLRRGSLLTARLVAFFSAFYLAGFAALVPIAIILLPFSLTVTVLRLYPVPAVLWLAFWAGLLAFLRWVYRQVTSQPALIGLNDERTGFRWLLRGPARGFVSGVALAAVLLVGTGLLIRGGTAERIRTQARREMGPGYEYFVASMSTGTSGTRGTIIAYNSREIRQVEVRWEE